MYKINKLHGYIIEHRIYSQYFMTTLNRAQIIKILNQFGQIINPVFMNITFMHYALSILFKMDSFFSINNNNMRESNMNVYMPSAF